MKIVMCAMVATLVAFGSAYAGGKNDVSENGGAAESGSVGNANVVRRGGSLQYTSGGVKLLLQGGSGSFQLYAVGRDGEEVPVLSGSDDFTSTYFSLLVGRTEYRLDSLGGTLSACGEAPSGLRMEYRVRNVVEVDALFTVMGSGATAFDDMVKVTVTCKNTSGRRNTFALKAVFDTVLGEKTGAHFSTATNAAINSETQFYGMERSKWVLSQGVLYGVQFLFYGADITEPDFVTLANKDVVSLPLWIPAVTSSRSFDNMTSYNNSVIAANWPGIELADGESGSVVFYIALSSNGAIPAGAAYIASRDRNYARELSQTAPIDARTATSNSGTASQRAASGNSSDIPDWKLSPEYVQMLIDRIEALDNDGAAIGDDELDYLNSEIDAIIKELGRR